MYIKQRVKRIDTRKLKAYFHHGPLGVGVCAWVCACVRVCVCAYVGGVGGNVTHLDIKNDSSVQE